MKTSSIYGCGIAVAVFVLTLVIHILGYLTDPDKFGIGIGVVTAGTAIILPITGLILGMKKVRAEKGAAGFSYGQAVTAGVLIGLFAAVGGVVFNFIYFKFINPEYTETMIVWTRSMMERAHMSDAVIDQAEASARVRTALPRQMVSGLIGGVIWNAVLSLILAAFIKRAPADPLRAPPVVAASN